MLGHICCQYLHGRENTTSVRAAGQRSLYVKSSSVPGPHHVDHHLPERLPLLLGQVLEDVAVLLLQQFEAHCQVVVLQDGLIVVHQCQLGICQNSTNMDSVCMQCGTPQRAPGHCDVCLRRNREVSFFVSYSPRACSSDHMCTEHQQPFA